MRQEKLRITGLFMLFEANDIMIISAFAFPSGTILNVLLSFRTNRCYLF